MEMWGEYSTFVTQTGVSADKLSLPPNTDSNIYQEYIVRKAIPEVIRAKVDLGEEVKEVEFSMIYRIQ